MTTANVLKYTIHYFHSEVGSSLYCSVWVMVSFRAQKAFDVRTMQSFVVIVNVGDELIEYYTIILYSQLWTYFNIDWIVMLCYYCCKNWKVCSKNQLRYKICQLTQYVGIRKWLQRPLASGCVLLLSKTWKYAVVACKQRRDNIQ